MSKKKKSNRGCVRLQAIMKTTMLKKFIIEAYTNWQGDLVRHQTMRSWSHGYMVGPKFEFGVVEDPAWVQWVQLNYWWHMNGKILKSI